MTALVVARGLGKRYGDRWVLRGVQLAIGPGLTAVVGPNGAGKTTLLKLLAGLLEPTEGSVEVLGASPRAARGLVLYAHQEALVLRGTVRSNILCPDPDMEVLRDLGLAPLLSERAHRLSGGYRKLLTVARVLACRPRVALLDEPTAFLDPDRRGAVMEAMRRLAAGGAAVVWSSHYPPEVEGAGALYEVRDGAVRPLRAAAGR